MREERIINFPDYAITDNGRVFHYTGKEKRELAPYEVKGLQYVTLYKGGRKIKKTFPVHRLVAEYFVNNPQGFGDVIFIDNDKSNLKHTNLYWGTSKGEYVAQVKDNRGKIWKAANWKFAIGDCINQHAKYGHPLELLFEKVSPRRELEIKEACKVVNITVGFQ